MTHVPASSHGSTQINDVETQGSVVYDDSGPLLDLLANAGFTFDLKVRDADDPLEYVLIRSPGLFRINSNSGSITLRDTPGTTNLFRYTGSTGICTHTLPAPTDGSLQTGEVSLTYDDTAAAPVLRLKGKDSAGNAKTGNIPLGRLLVTTGAPASGVGFLVNATRDLFVTVPVTYNPTAILTATCQVELSSDAGVSYTVLGTKTVPALAALAGLVDTVDVMVPAGWLMRLTVTNATLGTLVKF